MLSEARKLARSPAASSQATSVRTATIGQLVRRPSNQSSISEKSEGTSTAKGPPPPPPPPIPSTLRAVSRSPSASSASSDHSDRSSPKPTISRLVTTKIAPGKPIQRSNFPIRSPITPTISKQRNPIQTTPSASKNPLANILGQVSARDLETESQLSAFSPFSKGKTQEQSIFEKVNQHNGKATYLGTGTFVQLEDCIRNCLAHDKQRTEVTHHPPKYDYPSKSLTRASVLEDYSYEGLTPPHHHHGHGFSSDHHGHGSHHGHNKSAALLSLPELRQVNDALSKHGISVFSHEIHPHSHNRPRNIGEILNACQLLSQDPTIRAYSDNAHSVQNVWNSLMHQPPTNTPHGYASPAVSSVASHLFGNPQNRPHNPVQGVASHLFGNSSQNSYNPVQGGGSHLFGNSSQNSYNPGQSFGSHPFGNSSQNSYNPVQGVASRLFS